METNSTLLEDKIKLGDDLLKSVREVPDFPSPGILFKDINPVLAMPELCTQIVEHLADRYRSENLNAIVGIESRGFYFGIALAMKLNVPFIPVRKKGKLPGEVLSTSYDLEYGSAEVEIQKDMIHSGDRVLVHDDVLATGGTAMAAAELVKKSGGEVIGFNFLIALSFLKGEEKLNAVSSNIYNLAAT